jgi:hypothetical protein
MVKGLRIERRFRSHAEVDMPDQKAVEQEVLPDVREFSDRLMVIIGQALMEQIEQAQSEGKNMVAMQFGALDALTKQVSGALTACVAMVRRLSLSQEDFVRFRHRVHGQLEPAVLAVMNHELGRTGGQGGSPLGRRKSGNA